MACLRRVCGGKEAWNCRRGRWNGIPRGWGMRGAWEGAGNAWPRRASVYPRDSGEMSRRDARLRSPDRPQPPERQLRTFPGRRHVHAAPELCTRARRREADGSPHRAEDDYVDAGSGDFDLTRRELFAWRRPSISTLRGYLRCPQAATRVYINWHFAPAARDRDAHCEQTQTSLNFSYFHACRRAFMCAIPSRPARQTLPWHALPFSAMNHECDPSR